jgi:hypothetical protein
MSLDDSETLPHSTVSHCHIQSTQYQATVSFYYDGIVLWALLDGRKWGKYVIFQKRGREKYDFFKQASEDSLLFFLQYSDNKEKT